MEPLVVVVVVVGVGVGGDLLKFKTTLHLASVACQTLEMSRAMLRRAPSRSSRVPLGRPDLD